jgi:CheY-like chemotaxis protein
MPGMDGFQVARRLRGEPATRRSLIIALTGWGQDADRRRSREAGFDYHLVKPVDPTVIGRVLAEYRAFSGETTSPPAMLQ